MSRKSLSQERISSISFSDFKRKRKKKPGSSPGTVIYTGVKHGHSIDIEIIKYTNASIYNLQLSELSELDTISADKELLWVNVNGIHDVDLIKLMGEKFKIHPLFQEDISNVRIRPGIDEINNQIFASVKMLHIEKEKLKLEHISIILGPNYVISFQEYPGDVFNPIRKRLQIEKSRIREYNSDYLFYSLLDAVIDNYFIVLEFIGDKMENLEDRLESELSQNLLMEIQDQKREIIKLRKSVYPLREVVTKFDKSESALIHKGTKKYIRDLYEHTIQVIETTESFREFISSLTDLYNSALSSRMNNIMKVLTIIATIFIPLTFIAGIYGMNFENMPELHWEYGYYFVWGVMLLLFFGMMFYFRGKKWL